MSTNYQDKYPSPSSLPGKQSKRPPAEADAEAKAKAEAEDRAKIGPINFGKIEQLRKEIALATLALHEQTEIRNEAYKGMTKEQLIKAAWQLPELPDHLWNLKELVGGYRTGFITGSTIHAPNSDCNDLDWCTLEHPKAFSGYATNAENADYFDSDGFSSLYAHKNGQLINILCFADTRLYAAWEFATDIMKDLADSSSVCRKRFETKWRRVRVFDAFKDMYWPVYAMHAPLGRVEAIKSQICRRCGRPALFFTDQAHKTEYQKTAICERCQSTEF